MNLPFVPNVLRFRKSRRREKGGKEVRRVAPVLYQYAIASLENSRIFSNHLEMSRKTVTNFFKRNTRVLIRIIPTISYTKKPNDVRRGRGKGAVHSWYSFVRKDRVILEFESGSYEKAAQIAKIVRSKLPFKTTLLVNDLYNVDRAISMSKKQR